MDTCRVITVSDRCAAGLRDDVSGPLLVDARRGGYRAGVVVVPDQESVAAAVTEAVASGARVVLTTGGTGVVRAIARRKAPEGIDRELPGVAELLCARGLKHLLTPPQPGVAGVDATTTIAASRVNLPGSPNAASEGISLRCITCSTSWPGRTLTRLPVAWIS